MNWIDIVLIILLGYAIYDGYRDGVIVQAGGFVSLIFGVWAAYNYCTSVGMWLSIEEPVGTVVGFIVILVVVSAGVAIASRLLRGVFRITGLGILDRILGAIFSLLKMALITGGLLIFIHGATKSDSSINQKINQSRLFPCTEQVVEWVVQQFETMSFEICKFMSSLQE